MHKVYELCLLGSSVRMLQDNHVRSYAASQSCAVETLIRILRDHPSMRIEKLNRVSFSAKLKVHNYYTLGDALEAATGQDTEFKAFRTDSQIFEHDDTERDREFEAELIYRWQEYVALQNQPQLCYAADGSVCIVRKQIGV